MKRLSTLLLVLTALLALPLNGWAEEVLFDFQNNNLELTVGTSAADDGNISGKDIVKDGVTMRATSGGTMHARYFYTATNGNRLQILKDGRLRFTAPQGKAITKVVFELTTGNIHWSVDKGEGTLSTDMKTWEGNAASVRFLGTGTNYIDDIKVTVADATAETITPEADNYTPVASIAELNKLDDGTLAELTLTNAEVTALGVDGWTVYVQDATAAAHFYLLDQDFKAGNILNGKMKVAKYTQTSNPRIGTSEDFSAETYTVTTGEATAFEGSIAEVKTMDNINRLVKLTGVKFDVESKIKGTATDSEGNSIVVYNGTSGMSPHAISGDLQSYASATITGILYNVSTGLQIYPLSIEKEPVIFDFTSETIRENIGTVLADTKGYIYNETFNVNGTTLQVTAGSAPSRIYVDANRGQNLVTYMQYTTLTFRAPEGYAITKIEFKAAGNSNINKLTPSSGEVEGMIWTGNADGVRFAQGGTSYLANAIVTLEAATEATAALPAIEYTECANIAAFNALAAGTYAKVTLTDAEIIGKSADGYSTVWIQDATGGAWIQYTSLNEGLAEQKKVSGTVYTVKRNDAGKDAHFKEAEGTPQSDLTIADLADYTVYSCATIAEANEHVNQLVKIEGATFTATGATAGTLTLGEETIKVNNGTATANQQLHKIADEWVKDETTMNNVTIIGINTIAYGILPLSIEEEPVIFDFTSETIRENIGTALTDTKGYIYNETFNVNGTTLQVTAGSAPARIYVDANRGQCFVTYPQYTTLTFRAPEGYAITKIEFTAAGNSNINKLTPSSGEVEGMIWTGNADGVRFAQGGTSYLANAIVTLEAATEATAALPAIEYTECANIAAFNALAAGTYAKVTLKDAEVIGKSADGYSTVWIQDATGGAWIQYTSLNEGLAEQKKVSGTVYTVKRNDAGKDAHFKEAEDTPQSELTIDDLADYTVYSCATIAEVNKHINQLVKIEGATFTATSKTAGTLTLGEETIKVNNGTATANQQLHKIADEWVKDETTMNNVTIIGINTIAYGILPISMEELVALPDGKQYATFSSTVDLDFTGTDIIAYTGVVSGNKVTLTPIKQVPAGTGVLLKGKVAGASANVPVAAGLSAVENNDFVAVTETIGSLTEGYILATVEGVQAFYMANGNKVEAGKAYLKAAEAGARINMVFADEATGISTMHNAQCTMHNAQCTMHNGQCTMHNEVYNLQGQRVGNAQCTMHNAQLKPGLYIVNGKKVMVK